MTGFGLWVRAGMLFAHRSSGINQPGCRRIFWFAEVRPLVFEVGVGAEFVLCSVRGGLSVTCEGLEIVSYHIESYIYRMNIGDFEAVLPL